MVILVQKERPKFPKDFFTKPRPTITTKEALKDVIPFKWSKEVLEGKTEAIICSANKGKVL